MNQRRWILAVLVGLVEVSELRQVPLLVRGAAIAREALELVDFWIDVFRR